jgi:hypothetical protein
VIAGVDGGVGGLAARSSPDAFADDHVAVDGHADGEHEPAIPGSVNVPAAQQRHRADDRAVQGTPPANTPDIR